MTEDADEQELKGDFELDSLHAWMRVVASRTRRHCRDDVRVDVYGKADALCLVIEKNVPTSPPRSVDQDGSLEVADRRGGRRYTLEVRMRASTGGAKSCHAWELRGIQGGRGRSERQSSHGFPGKSTS